MVLKRDPHWGGLPGQCARCDRPAAAKDAAELVGEAVAVGRLEMRTRVRWSCSPMGRSTMLLD